MRAAAGCPVLKMAVVPERRRQRGSHLLRTVITSQFQDVDQRLVTLGSSLQSTCSSQARQVFEAGYKRPYAGSLGDLYRQFSLDAFKRDRLNPKGRASPLVKLEMCRHLLGPHHRSCRLYGIVDDCASHNCSFDVSSLPHFGLHGGVSQLDPQYPEALLDPDS